MNQPGHFYVIFGYLRIGFPGAFYSYVSSPYAVSGDSVTRLMYSQRACRFPSCVGGMYISGNRDAVERLLAYQVDEAWSYTSALVREDSTGSKAHKRSQFRETLDALIGLKRITHTFSSIMIPSTESPLE